MSEQGQKLFDSLSESEKQTLGAKIKEILHNIMDMIKKMLGTYKSDTYEARALQKYQDKLQEIAKIWDEMLLKSVEANQALEKSGAFEKEASADGNVKYSRRIDKKRKTNYNEYNTQAMIWANAADRQLGDLTILSVNYYDFVLIEATEDGFIELKKGTYKEVQAEYERAYRKANNEIYGNLESYESDQGTDIWDMQFHGKGRNGNGNPKQIEREGLQDNSSRNNEHLRNSNQGKYEKSKIDKEESYVGIIVKEYPNNKNSNVKFCLHEAIIIKADSPFMTAPQLSVDAMSESASTDSISDSSKNVKKKIPIGILPVEHYPKDSRNFSRIRRFVMMLESSVLCITAQMLREDFFNFIQKMLLRGSQMHRGMQMLLQEETRRARDTSAT